ncbi:aminotransferase class I/II-fold pyridoxal phosphate-dependent enzyme [Peterkaempfera sp. SMS 1(5)a]|uniref:aminotransferase class I/II-fold pyridoxal phosphate-dependent enzyme n=1 Tax=Peterkaempfera podocarpi TaxID=3232308 RepID=UPI00366ABB1F
MYVAPLLGEGPYGVGEGIVLDDVRRLAAGLADAGFEVHAPQGTYFITTDIARLAPGVDALAFCRSLPERCGVVAVPSSVFYDHPTAGRTQVRFAFCKQPDVLTEAAERLRKAFAG